MNKLNLSLKLITTALVRGDRVKEFCDSMVSCGYLTYIEDYCDYENLTDEVEFEVQLFKTME